VSELHSLRLVLAVAKAATDTRRTASQRALAIDRLPEEIARHEAAMGRPTRPPWRYPVLSAEEARAQGERLTEP
jgi:hypothetical protein